MHTAWEKNLSTGIWFKPIILKGFLWLDLQPVQLISPTSITRQNNPPALQGYRGGLDLVKSSALRSYYPG